MRAANLPPGVYEEQFAAGLIEPTAMQFAPDGRLFIAQQGGTILIVKDGQLLSTPFVDIAVDAGPNTGLLGLAFDPDFSQQPYVYVHYTVATQPRHNRVSRFTANGDVAVAGSEVALLELDDITNGGHFGGALHFGADGTLFLAVGDNLRSGLSQALDSLFGKVLRINADGSMPADNPFVGVATGKYQAIWALGLRNPFTFAVQPGTGRIFINDVGQGTWEEINEGAAGANYGWNIHEGPTSEPGFVSPIHWYGHGNTSSTGCAITGGAFYNPPVAQFPELVGRYFFSDYCGGWIRHLDPAQPSESAPFATGIASPVDLKVGPDGGLYYLARDQGAVYRVLAPEPGHHVLAVTLAGSGGGSIASTPGGLSCPDVTCSDSFGDGTLVELTATPSGDSTFAGWEGSCTGAGACVVSMDDDESVTATFHSRYDLSVSALTSPPSIAVPGTAFSVTSATTNQGVVATPESFTRFYLSTDSARDTADTLLVGTHVVPSLPSGSSASATTTVTVPATLMNGVYWLLGCADAPGTIPEFDEVNNCLVSTTSVQVERPDLVVTNIATTATHVAPKGKLTVTETAFNQGLVAAAATVTRYYFSFDALKSANDVRLTATRAVGTLPSGVGSSGSAVLTVPTSMAIGTYSLLVCADDTALVAEKDETNNCTAAPAVVTVVLADLVQTAVSNPPASGTPGTSFSASETVQNGSAASSVTSTTTRYYLSPDALKDATDILFAASRTVPILAGGASSTGTPTLKIPTSMSLGTYYLLACADSGNVLSESVEGNNCLAAATTLLVSLPDLVTPMVSSPPAVAAPGTSFVMGDSVSNQGAVGAVPTTTRYFLSIDGVRGASDLLLTGTRSVPALAAGATSTGSRTVTVPTTTVLGTYFVLACADDVAKAAETNEANNCNKSPTAVVVGRPDLIVYSLTNPPATTAPGQSFTVTDLTRNDGNYNAAASTTRFFLSMDATKDAGDILLGGTRSIPSLAPLASSSGTKTVTVPTTTPVGSYRLLACADDLNKVTETQESNNCSAAATLVTVQP
jgi:glucose/arabinose dehydrogenase/subtilase family serine protease